jgi:phenylacetate-CoA ligase
MIYSLEDLKTRPASFWERLGEKKVLSLFHLTAKTVPAYKKLLREKNITPNRIKNIEDFKKLPVIDKDSYCRKYPFEELFPNKDLSIITTFSATSGSTSEPFYFPRGEAEDRQYEYVAENFLKNQWEIDSKSTLGILGFGLGIWIGGIFTYKNFNKLAQKGYKISLIPVGPNKELFLKSLKKFGHLFDQVILMGYPPFIKDVIDEAQDYGINFKNYCLRILTAAEGFSEEFRSYLVQKAHLKNPMNDIINIYGTVELGTMAHETAFSNLIRKIACQKTKVFQKIFPEANRIPTLAQYYPWIIYFEEIKGEVIGSGSGSAIPLLRYRFPDKGGVISFNQMIVKLNSLGIDIFKEAKKMKLDKTILKLPFVYVYERSDFAVHTFGINIYPEYIRDVFRKKPLADYFTGKFTMISKNDRRQNQFLEINVELKKNKRIKKGLIQTLRDFIVNALIEKSTEYNYLYKNSPPVYQKRLLPKIVIWPYENPVYFPIGVKQKWTKKLKKQ